MQTSKPEFRISSKVAARKNLNYHGYKIAKVVDPHHGLTGKKEKCCNSKTGGKGAKRKLYCHGQRHKGLRNLEKSIKRNIN